MNGIEATRAIRAKQPAVCIIGLSMSDYQDSAMRQAGAVGFVSKSGPVQLVATMRACYQRMREELPPAAAA
jgi:DNA-binding NarL/FixJ family response regulator